VYFPARRFSDIISNSAIEIFSPNQKEQRQKVVTTQIWKLIFAHLATLKSRNSKVDNLLKDTTETESEVAEKSSWDQANRGQKLGLVRRNRKKISTKLKGHI
jgi:hypothetical protein